MVARSFGFGLSVSDQQVIHSYLSLRSVMKAASLDPGHRDESPAYSISMCSDRITKLALQVMGGFSFIQIRDSSNQPRCLYVICILFSCRQLCRLWPPRTI